MKETVETTAVSAVYGADNVNETIDNEAVARYRELIENSSINIPEELKGDVEFFASLDGAYEEFDTERENLVAKLLLANTPSLSASSYWVGFDLVGANQFQMFDYIISHADFDYDKSKSENRTHYLIYVIQNTINGKIYVGQHQTENIDDDYMGSGRRIEESENKYGIENFEKTILHDFYTFDEMNQKEADIVTDVFWRKKDCCYNLHEGGIYGPSSEFQKEMHRLGLWSCYNNGKTMYHNENGDTIWIDDGTEPPDGWIIGKPPTEEYIAFHKQIDDRMKILRSYGSVYTWRQGDTLKVLDNMIEQFKKAEEKDRKLRIVWKEILEYYKENGSTKTSEKYMNVEGICNIRENLKRYYPDEFEKICEKENYDRDDNKRKYDELLNTLLSYGFERQWNHYRYNNLVELYNRFMKNKEKIDKKVEKINKIFDEFLEYGIAYVSRKYNDTNLYNKFIKYVPLRYKQYVFEKYGKIIEVEENVYKSYTSSKFKDRKARRKTENEIKRQKEVEEERLRLISELNSLGSAVKYRKYIAISTLKLALKRTKQRIEKQTKEIEKYENMYNEWVEHGFKEMCKKFNYTGTKGNLKRRFKKYVKNYDKRKIEGRW